MRYTRGWESMPAFWERWLGGQKQPAAPMTLVDYAANYLVVFEVATQEEKTRHATELFEAANDTAREAGANDFLALMEDSRAQALAEAAVYSRRCFEEMGTAGQGRYWLSAYALTHLMVLNFMKSLEDTPRAKLTADNAAYLYSAEYARRKSP